MKKLITFIALACISIFSFSQSYFTSTTFQVCVYNEYTEAYEDCITKNQQNMFFIPADESYISFHTEEGKTTYFITEKNPDITNSRFWYVAVFTDGTKYVVMFDLPNKQVRLTQAGDENGIVSIYYVDAMWVEE